MNASYVLGEDMYIPIITSLMQESYEAGALKSIFQTKWLSKYDIC